MLILCAAICAPQVRPASPAPAAASKETASKSKDTKEKAGGVRFTYGTGPNQWANIYQAPSKNNKPTPVYIWSHPNSDGKTPPSANNIPKGMVDNCNDAGVTVISWESVPQVKSLDDVKTCRADLLKLYDWILANAKIRNLDINNLFIGGASRGTVVSWDFICKSPEKIRGAYLTQALPVAAWLNPAETPLTPMTANNPPVVLSYRGLVGTKDGHDPKYGKRIADKYAELGIADRATVLVDQKNQYAALIDFINKYKKQ